MQTIGDRIREARKRAGLSQQQLADAVPIKGGRQQIYHWEAGDYSPRPKAIERIAKITGTTPAWIVYGVGEMDGRG